MLLPVCETLNKNRQTNICKGSYGVYKRADNRVIIRISRGIQGIKGTSNQSSAIKIKALINGACL